MSTKGLAPSYSYTDDDQNNLRQLLEMFGSAISLKDITSSYSKAGRDLQAAADILCSMNLTTCDASSALNNPKKSAKATSNGPSGSSSNHNLGNDHTAKTKAKKSSASLGTVSNVIGKEYITPKPQAAVSCEKRKSVLLTSDDIPASEIWNEEKELAANSRTETMDSDLEEFVHKMLGSGFGLDKNLIHDVIGQCGYNMRMSIDKLLDISAVTMEKSEDANGLSSGINLKNGFDLKSGLGGTQPTVNGISKSSKADDVINGDEPIPPQSEKSKKDVQREVLEALFSLPEITEEKPKLKGPELVDKDSPHIVTKPLRETPIEDFTFITRQPIRTKNGDVNEKSYEELRASTKEFWQLMKEYYKAAVDSFVKDDYEKAQNHMEKGHFYMNKAKEFEEKSAEKLTEDKDADEELSLNVYHLEPREAMRSLRLHLKTLSALPTIRYIKAVIGTEGGGKKDRRRKTLITELLEKEGIPWTEDGDGLIITVRVDVIDPNNLSFANK